MSRSRSSTAVLAFSLLILSAPATERARGAAPSYNIIDLGTFGTVQSAQALEINEAGHLAGNAASRPFLWQSGSMIDLGSIGGLGASATALNDNGQIVGYSRTAAGSPTRAVLWSNGSIINLTPDIPSTQGSTAAAINESGQIVGNVGQGQAFLWQNNVRTPLGHLGGGASFASDISDAGVVVGSSYTSDVTPLGIVQHPFSWQNGQMTNLGLLDGDQDGGAAGINGLGQIVGSSGSTDPDTYESRYRAFLYSNDTMTALPVPSTEAYAGDISDHGVIVGSMRAGGAVSNWHGWIYDDGVVTNLNHLIPQGTGLHIAFANAINNAGEIAATAFDSRGHYHAVLLKPGTSPPPTPGITVFDVSLSEGQNGTTTASFSVRLSFSASQDVTVSYGTANGTATAGTDYDATSGTLTIPAGQLIRTIAVTVRGDRKREPDEVFYMNLGNPAGATIVDGQGVGTLRNDDR